MIDLLDTNIVITLTFCEGAWQVTDFPITYSCFALANQLNFPQFCIFCLHVVMFACSNFLVTGVNLFLKKIKNKRIH
jgi:hypothetical protein